MSIRNDRREIPASPQPCQAPQPCLEAGFQKQGSTSDQEVLEQRIASALKHLTQMDHNIDVERGSVRYSNHGQTWLPDYCRAFRSNTLAVDDPEVRTKESSRIGSLEIDASRRGILVSS